MEDTQGTEPKSRISIAQPNTELVVVDAQSFVFAGQMDPSKPGVMVTNFRVQGGGSFVHLMGSLLYHLKKHYGESALQAALDLVDTFEYTNVPLGEVQGGRLG